MFLRCLVEIWPFDREARLKVEVVVRSSHASNLRINQYLNLRAGMSRVKEFMYVNACEELSKQFHTIHHGEANT